MQSLIFHFHWIKYQDENGVGFFGSAPNEHVSLGLDYTCRSDTGTRIWIYETGQNQVINYTRWESLYETLQIVYDTSSQLLACFCWYQISTWHRPVLKAQVTESMLGKKQRYEFGLHIYCSGIKSQSHQCHATKLSFPLLIWKGGLSDFSLFSLIYRFLDPWKLVACVWRAA